MYHGDPPYLPIVRNGDLSLLGTIQSGPPSLFLNLPVSPGIVTASSFSSVPSGKYSAAQIFSWLQSNGFFRESFSTDAWQAQVVYNQNGEVEGAFLGGGTMLSTPQVTLTATMASGSSGLVFVEYIGGHWELGNASSAASVRVEIVEAGIDETVVVPGSSSVALKAQVLGSGGGH